MLPDIYEAIEKEVSCLCWCKVGPANVKHYDIAEASTPTLTLLINYLSSEHFSQMIERITGCQIFQSLELRRFKKGDYTLIHDETLLPPGLDLIYSFATTCEWEDAWGGQLNYISDEEALLTLKPNKNELTLVYRDEAMLGFVKYMNASAGDAARIELSGLWTI